MFFNLQFLTDLFCTCTWFGSEITFRHVNCPFLFENKNGMNEWMNECCVYSHCSAEYGSTEPCTAQGAEKVWRLILAQWPWGSKVLTVSHHDSFGLYRVSLKKGNPSFRVHYSIIKNYFFKNLHIIGKLIFSSFIWHHNHDKRVTHDWAGTICIGMAHWHLFKANQAVMHTLKTIMNPM